MSEVEYYILDLKWLMFLKLKLASVLLSCPCITKAPGYTKAIKWHLIKEQ